MTRETLKSHPARGDLDEEFKALIDENAYVETQIATKYGEFSTRVYRSVENKETVVLWTGELSDAYPPLVRVHSECLTGDVIGSLKCDCGKQLHKAMNLIQDRGGILIYLRQEGRGIGLFEKIKAYKLQSEGYDTFEANTLLGHHPDARTYEMVKVVLDDFSINRIRILTNNPFKVSEIAKYGIEVVERVPLVIQPNKHNRKYFETKKKKFHHSFGETHEKYYYGFHIDKASELKSLGKNVSLQLKDPFLNLYVGITTTPGKLTSKKERARIEEIYKLISTYEDLIPVLHVSFKSSTEPGQDLDAIREVFPFARRLQLNDLEQISYSLIKKACKLFEIVLPLADENFEILENPKVRSLIKTQSGTILLDNSKGTGKIEMFDNYRGKIDQLFEWGLRNVALCGGFGPDQLETYYALRRYYRVNFSIDAESKLKRENRVDVSLTQKYLSQLLDSTVPSAFGVAQTKAFMKKQRRTKWDSMKVEGKEFSIHPKVFHAGKFPSSLWYAEILAKRVAGEKDFCEVGCGAGLATCLIGLRNPSIKVVATDVNPFAAENTRKNAKVFNLTRSIRVVTADVLDGLKKKDLFDTIFWALPFGFLDAGSELNLEEMQVFDPGYRAIRKFFQTAKRHLKPGGRLLIGFSTELGDVHLLQKFAKEFHLKLRKKDTAMLTEEKEIEFELLEGRYF